MACSREGAKGSVDMERTWDASMPVPATEGIAADCPIATGVVDVAFYLDKHPLLSFVADVFFEPTFSSIPATVDVFAALVFLPTFLWLVEQPPSRQPLPPLH